MFPFEGAVPLETEQPDDGHQAQPLPDQRCQDDTEGEEDHEIALREQHATGEREGQCQSCGQGEATAHADPGDHHHIAPSWIRVTATQARADQAWKIGHRKDPGNAHGDDGQADEQRLPDQGNHRVTHNSFQNATQLQPDEQKDQAVEQEDQHIPHRIGLQARIGGEEARRLPTQVKASRQHGQDP